VDLDDYVGAVEAHREFQRGAGVFDGVGYQFVGDEYGRLGALTGDAPGPELTGDAPRGFGGRGQDRRECPAHRAGWCRVHRCCASR
jgi:hypothetical protein